MRALRRTANCIAIDLPGHGKSEDNEACESIEAHARWVVRFMDHLGIDTAILAGHSMGAAIALECTLGHPKRVSALGIVGVGAVIPVSTLVLEALRGTGDIWTTLMNDLLFSPRTPRRFADKSSASGLQAPRAVVRRDFVACSRWDRRGDLGGINVPCLLICGADDALTPPPLMEALSTELSQSRLEVVDDAGHMVMIEQHKRVNELLHTFVDKAHKTRPPIAR